VIAKLLLVSILVAVIVIPIRAARARSARLGLRKMVRDLTRVRVAVGDGRKKVYPSEAGAVR